MVCDHVGCGDRVTCCAVVCVHCSVIVFDALGGLRVPADGVAVVRAEGVQTNQEDVQGCVVCFFHVLGVSRCSAGTDGVEHSCVSHDFGERVPIVNESDGSPESACRVRSCALLDEACTVFYFACRDR